MVKPIIKILIIIFAAFFLPSIAFGFFLEPDQYLHSMPFGTQKNNPGNISTTPPPNFQNFTTIKTETGSLGVANNKEDKSDLPKTNNFFLPAVLIFGFFIILIFLIVKIIIV